MMVSLTQYVGTNRIASRRFLQLRRLEAAREIASYVANSNNKLMLDSDALLLDRQFPSLTHCDGT